VLIKIKRLVIENEGYSRKIHLEAMYINKQNIVSIVDYSGVNEFLLRENSSYSDDQFSLVKINEGNDISEIIAYGSAESIFTAHEKQDLSGKQLLSD